MHPPLPLPLFLSVCDVQATGGMQKRLLVATQTDNDKLGAMPSHLSYLASNHPLVLSVWDLQELKGPSFFIPNRQQAAVLTHQEQARASMLADTQQQLQNASRSTQQQLQAAARAAQQQLNDTTQSRDYYKHKFEELDRMRNKREAREADARDSKRLKREAKSEEERRIIDEIAKSGQPSDAGKFSKMTVSKLGLYLVHLYKLSKAEVSVRALRLKKARVDKCIGLWEAREKDDHPWG